MAVETDMWVKPLVKDGNSAIEDVRLFVEKERAIYVALNKFEGGSSTLRAECWSPCYRKSCLPTKGDFVPLPSEPFRDADFVDFSEAQSRLYQH